MGATGSKNLNQQYQRLNRMVGSIVDENNNLKFGDFKSISDNVCSNVVVLIQRDLAAHANKDDIFEIGKDVHVIPRDYVGQDTARVCGKIGSYYEKVLKIILMIKVVLDAEHNGDLTFAGIIAKNVTVHQGVMSIAYCDLPHTDKDESSGRYHNGVDFEKLESFNYFIKNALGEREYRAFLTNLRLQLARDTKSRMCRDEHVQDARMSLITGRKKFADKSPACVSRRAAQSMRLSVEKMNPVFVPDACFSQQQLSVPAADPKVNAALAAFHDNYKGTLAAVEALLARLVVERKGADGNSSYELRRIPYKGVVAVEAELKALIKELHLRTITDFQALINVAIEAKKRQVANSSIFSSA